MYMYMYLYIHTQIYILIPMPLPLMIPLMKHSIRISPPCTPTAPPLHPTTTLPYPLSMHTQLHT